jgi:hypothetical protein
MNTRLDRNTDGFLGNRAAQHRFVVVRERAGDIGP